MVDEDSDPTLTVILELSPFLSGLIFRAVLSQAGVLIPINTVFWK